MATQPTTTMVQQGDDIETPCIYHIIPSPDATSGTYEFRTYGTNQFNLVCGISFAEVAAAFASWNQFTLVDYGTYWEATSLDFYARAIEADEHLFLVE